MTPLEVRRFLGARGTETIPMETLRYHRTATYTVVIEASAAGFRAGAWPETIIAQGDESEGFLLREVITHGDDIDAVIYQSQTSATRIHVLND